MILIITHKLDFTADFVVNKLNQRNLNYKRFNCEDILGLDCSISLDKSLRFSILGEEGYSSIWFRRTKLPEIKGMSLQDKRYVLNETDSLMSNLYSILDARWLSHPFAIQKAENKLLQLKIAKGIGFDIPPTLITNSKTELSDFYREHGGTIIVKPMAQTRVNDTEAPRFVFTNLLTQKHIDNLDMFSLTPSIYQREIKKDYEVRVTVVGRKVFAAKVDSQANSKTRIDWRREKLEFLPIELPKQICDYCIQLVESLDLKFGAIDLIKERNGAYVFLEINPNGQWAWIETQTGLKISDAIINELSNEEN